MRASAIAILVGMATVAWAGQSASRPASRPAMPTMARDGDEDTLMRWQKQFIAELKLTEKQEPRVRQLVTAYRKALTDWRQEHTPEMKKLQAMMKTFHRARDAQARKRVKAAMQDLARLRAEQGRMTTDLLTELGKVLTKEQHAIARKMLGPQQRSGRKKAMGKWHQLTELGLTPKQLGQIKAIMSEATKSAGAGPKGPKGMPGKDPMAGAWRRILTEVLTEKDRQRLADRIKMASHRRMVLSGVDRLTLTEEQSRKVEAMWKKAFIMANAHGQNKFAIYVQVREEIMAKVLTEQQRKMLKPKTGGGPGHGTPSEHPTARPAPPHRPAGGV